MKSTLYKFRPPEPFGRILDILNNERLYCAKFNTLNDPMEGVYSMPFGNVEDDDRRQQYMESLENEKLGLRICSLSRASNYLPMWALYADNSRGIAIELELSDADFQPIDYSIQYPTISPEPVRPLNDIAMSLLRWKHKDWGNEKEVRIIQKDQYYKLPANSIKSVTCGSRIDHNISGVIDDICDSKNIKVVYQISA